ncbi:MAG: SRPBCC family protein [Pseudomonadota bacterium]|nr:SRPBCC family protein [Pseudomonadota bacterium]
MTQTLETVEVRRQFDHPAGLVWVLTGDFGGLQNWLPGVTGVTVTGSGSRQEGGNAERAVQLLDGSVTRESLESQDEAAMCYEYAILSMKGFKEGQVYTARFQVKPLTSAEGERCEVIWSARFSVPEDFSADQVAKARSRVEQMYGFFLTHLAGLL